MYERNLIEYLPHLIRDVREYKAILNDAEQMEMVDGWQSIDNALNDQFIIDATENGVERWEKILGIVPQATLTLDERKFAIAVRINEQLPFTLTFLNEQLKTLCGENGFSISLDNNLYSLFVQVALKAKSNYDSVRFLLERVVPANLIINLSLKYNQHKTLADYTHRELKEYTNYQLRNEELKNVLSPVLADNSWKRIAKASEEGIADTIWQIGDEKEITAYGETLTAVIVGFNHDDKTDGSGKAGITFGLKNLMSTTQKMNWSNTNVGGYINSNMHIWLKNTLLPSLPSDLREVIKTVNKRTSVGDYKSTINTDSMEIFLFSEIEVFGTYDNSIYGEGIQYNYFTNPENRIKYQANGSGSAIYWWERSPSNHNNTAFCNVNSDGSANGYNNAIHNGGICFGYCI